MLKPSIYHLPLTFLVCTLLFSFPNVATAGYESVKIAEKLQTTSPNIKATAIKAEQEAEKLYYQGTLNLFKQAIEKWKEALALWQKIDAKAEQARTLKNIASVYYFLGETNQALEYYNQSLVIYKVIKDNQGEATTLNNLGSIYSTLGQTETAFKYYNQSLSLYQSIGNKGGEAATLSNIGSVYFSLQQMQTALKYYNQALPLYKKASNTGGETVTLHNISPIGENSSFTHISSVYTADNLRSNQNPDKKARGYVSGEAATLNNMGSVYHDLDQNQKALDYYNQALLMYQEIGDKRGEATTAI